MTIAFWREIDNNLKYKHLEVVDYFLCKYNVMIYRGDSLILYVDKGRFGQS